MIEHVLVIVLLELLLLMIIIVYKKEERLAVEHVILIENLIHHGHYIVRPQVVTMIVNVIVKPEQDGHVHLMILVQVGFQCVSVLDRILVRDVVLHEHVLPPIMETHVLRIP